MRWRLGSTGDFFSSLFPWSHKTDSASTVTDAPPRHTARWNLSTQHRSLQLTYQQQNAISARGTYKHGRKVMLYMETALRDVRVPTACAATRVLKLARKNMRFTHPQRIILIFWRLQNVTSEIFCVQCVLGGVPSEHKFKNRAN